MIGLFDSGVGGLTILKVLREKLPQYDYIYLGDSARAPYGPRSNQEVIDFTWQGIEWLFKQGAPLVILACNTAGAVALRTIQQTLLPQHYPDRRVLGIVVPTIEQITGASWHSHTPTTTPISDNRYTVTVLATPRTVKSHTYKTEVHKRNPSIKVDEQACPNLAHLIEDNAIPNLIDQELQACLAPLQQTPPNAVLLGCTHYELIADRIRQHLSPKTKLYHQPTIVAQSLAHYLAAHPEVEQNIDKTGAITIYTTGNPDRFQRYTKRFLGHQEPVQGVKLTNNV